VFRRQDDDAEVGSTVLTILGVDDQEVPAVLSDDHASIASRKVMAGLVPCLPSASNTASRSRGYRT
jgi:hypothetical protein